MIFNPSIYNTNISHEGAISQLVKYLGKKVRRDDP